MPQTAPLIRVTAVNNAPIGAEAMASSSHSLMRQTSAITLWMAMITKIDMLIQAAGTWMYRMRKLSPCL